MQVNPDFLVRSLPEAPEILAKLAEGSYTLHGGVVRHSAGTGKGGQIVGHLLFPGDPARTQQGLQELQSVVSSGMSSIQGGLEGLQMSMNVIQGLQAANLVMAGLNLAVTTAGFVIVCRKLDKISSQIQAQSNGIAEVLRVVSEIHDKGLLLEEARFRSLLLSTQQFCEQVDIVQLKHLIPQFHLEYQFTKLVLERHASIAKSNVDRINEINLLQDRLLNLGLGLTHIQLKSGSPDYGRKFLLQLADDVMALNAKRIEVMAANEDVAAGITHQQFESVKLLLGSGRDAVPSLTYQADIIELDARRPGLLQSAEESQDILLVAA